MISEITIKDIGFLMRYGFFCGLRSFVEGPYALFTK